MNTLPRIYDDREHKQWLKVCTAMMATRAFNEAKPRSSAGKFLGELAERIEEYEKLRWPLDELEPRRKRRKK